MRMPWRYAVVHQEPEPITALRVGLPVDLDRIVAKAMAKSPDERYQHVDEMLVDLRAVQREFTACLKTNPERSGASTSHHTPR